MGRYLPNLKREKKSHSSEREFEGENMKQKHRRRRNTGKGGNKHPKIGGITRGIWKGGKSRKRI